MVLLIRQFFLGLARRGSCQIGPKHFCKPQVRFLSYQSNSLNFKAEERNQRRLDRVHCTVTYNAGRLFNLPLASVTIAQAHNLFAT
ncbi:MAG TPA: hypothetical protein VGQ08_00060 [Nitrospiraceae bacterium]|jgi:hypothetical protein|nr:hypothetical protein [Nitrospiraceae bacterium]